MRIEYTNIPNVTPEKTSIEENKITLANSVIENVYPLFDDIYEDRQNQISELQNNLQKLKEEINERKKKLEQFSTELKKQKKISKLLKRIEKMIRSGLLFDGSLKHEMKILLKVINKLDDEKLEFHLQETLKIISKRFSQG